VRHFVPDGILDQPGEVFGAGGEALVRALEDGDAVRHGEGLEDAAPGKRAAFVQAQQSAARGVRPRASCSGAGSGSTITATFFRRLRKRAGMRA